MGASLWEGWHKTINHNSHSCFCRRENVYSVLLIHPWVCNNCSFKDNGYSSLKWWSWSFLFTSAWYTPYNALPEQNKIHFRTGLIHNAAILLVWVLSSTPMLPLPLPVVLYFTLNCWNMRGSSLLIHFPLSFLICFPYLIFKFQFLFRVLGYFYLRERTSYTSPFVLVPGRGETCGLLETVADCQLPAEKDFQSLHRREILLKHKVLHFSMIPFVIVFRAIFLGTE